MANGAAFDHAVELARETPGLDVGVHLVMVQGESVSEPGTMLPSTVGQLAAALLTGRIRPYEEARAQVKRIIDAGIRPSHIDTHKHTHLLPPVLKALARVAREFEIPWVRRPFDFRAVPGAGLATQAISTGMSLVKSNLTNMLDGLRMSDHFTGFQVTGLLDIRTMLDTLNALPDGLTEFMCHPGQLGPELRSARTRLKESRAIELAALTSPEVRDMIDRRGIVVTNFREASATA